MDIEIFTFLAALLPSISLFITILSIPSNVLKWCTSFFYKQRFFLTQPQCCLFFNELNLKCCLIVAYYTEALPYTDTHIPIFVSMFTSWSIYVFFMWSIFPLSFSFTINDIISLTQTNLFIGHACQKFSLRVVLNFCLVFC